MLGEAATEGVTLGEAATEGVKLGEAAVEGVRLREVDTDVVELRLAVKEGEILEDIVVDEERLGDAVGEAATDGDSEGEPPIDGEGEGDVKMAEKIAAAPLPATFTASMGTRAPAALGVRPLARAAQRRHEPPPLGALIAAVRFASRVAVTREWGMLEALSTGNTTSHEGKRRASARARTSPGPASAARVSERAPPGEVVGRGEVSVARVGAPANAPGATTREAPTRGKEAKGVGTKKRQGGASPTGGKSSPCEAAPKVRCVEAAAEVVTPRPAAKSSAAAAAEAGMAREKAAGAMSTAQFAPARAREAFAASTSYVSVASAARPQGPPHAQKKWAERPEGSASENTGEGSHRGAAAEGRPRSSAAAGGLRGTYCRRARVRVPLRDGEESRRAEGGRHPRPEARASVAPGAHTQDPEAAAENGPHQVHPAPSPAKPGPQVTQALRAAFGAEPIGQLVTKVGDGSGAEQAELPGGDTRPAVHAVQATAEEAPPETPKVFSGQGLHDIPLPKKPPPQVIGLALADRRKLEGETMQLVELVNAGMREKRVSCVA